LAKARSAAVTADPAPAAPAAATPAAADQKPVIKPAPKKQ